MRPVELARHLRLHGVFVHGVHARRLPPSEATELVVFLEQNLGHQKLARELTQRLPGVLDVRFRAGSPALMYVRCAARDGSAD